MGQLRRNPSSVGEPEEIARIAFPGLQTRIESSAR
jgi:hypothetical protein